MELLETSDPKRELMRRSARSKAALEEEVRVFTERTEKVVTNVLIFGGVLALSYLVVRGLSRKSKGKKKTHTITAVAQPVAEIPVADEPSPIADMLGTIGTAVASQATAFLLTLAKEKLLEYMSEEKQRKHGDS